MEQEVKPTGLPFKWATLVAIIIIVLCALAASAFYGFQYGYKKAEQETKAKYEETVSTFMPPMPEEQTYFSGTVEKIEGKTVYVKGAKPTTEVLEMGQEITMKVLVTDATKIFKMAMVAPKEMPTPEEGVPPEPFKKTEMAFEDIKEGMSVSVTAGENIIGKEEFEAVEIQISEAL